MAACLSSSHIDGGNDGLNTVVPFADENYAKYRKDLRLPTRSAYQSEKRNAARPSPGDKRDAGKLLESKTDWRLSKASAIPIRIGRTFAGHGDLAHGTVRPGRPPNSFGWLGRGLDGARVPADNAPASLFLGTGALPARCAAGAVWPRS